MDKSASESDLKMLEEKTPPSFVFSRYKRMREESPTTTDEFSDFKEEIKKMLASFATEKTKELQQITSTLKDIQQTNQNIEQAVTFLTAQNEELRKKVELLENKRQEDKKYIALLEDRLEDVQRNSRKTSLEIRNVPKKTNETREDLIEMAICLSENVGSSMKKQDIRDIYRVRGKKEASNLPIIVETNSTMVKTDVLKMSKVFNTKHKVKLCAKHLGHRVAEDTPVFVSEHLTAKAARLHFLARDLAKAKGFKFCWTAFGKVYVRKDETAPIVTIRSEAHVHQLLQQGT